MLKSKRKQVWRKRTEAINEKAKEMIGSEFGTSSGIDAINCTDTEGSSLKASVLGGARSVPADEAVQGSLST